MNLSNSHACITDLIHEQVNGILKLTIDYIYELTEPLSYNDNKINILTSVVQIVSVNSMNANADTPANTK